MASDDDAVDRLKIERGSNESPRRRARAFSDHVASYPAAAR